MFEPLIDQDIHIGSGRDHLGWLALMNGRLDQIDRQPAVNSLGVLQILAGKRDLVAALKQEFDQWFIASQMPQACSALPREEVSFHG